MTRPSPLGISRIQFPPFIEVRSKYRLLIMRGNDVSKWTHKFVRGYALIAKQTSSVVQCDHCHKQNIVLGSFYGYNAAEFHRHVLCRDCLDLPKDFTVFEVKIKLNRKSGRNPNGIRTEFVVSTVKRIRSWAKKAVQVYPGITIRHLYDHISDKAKNESERSERLDYILKQLWDFLPEQAV